MIQKRNIKPCHNTPEDEALGVDKDFLEDNFCKLIVGKPGSGKSFLIEELLLHPNLYNKKFEHVFIFSPYPLKTIPCQFNKNWFPMWSPTKMMELVKWCIDNKTKHVLFILDDVIADIKKNQNDASLMKLFFNRRHLLPDGAISYMITTQKYIICPPRLRSCLTSVIFFKVQKNDFRKIKEECIYSDSKYADQIIAEHLKKDPHNFVYCLLSKGKTLLNFDNELK